MIQTLKSIAINILVATSASFVILVIVGFFAPTSITITGTDRHYISRGETLESWAKDFQSTLEKNQPTGDNFSIQAGEATILFPEGLVPYIETKNLKETLGRNLYPFVAGEIRRAWMLVKPYSIQSSIKPNTATGSWELIARDIERQLGLTPLSEGSISVDVLGETPSVSFTPSQAGISIDPSWVQNVVLMFLLEEKTSFPLDQLKTIRPKTSLAELQKKKEILELAYSKDITLTLEEFAIKKTLSPKTTASILWYEWSFETLEHELAWNKEALQEALGKNFGTPSDEAFLVNEDYTISIQDQKPGLDLDAEGTVSKIVSSIQEGVHTIEIMARPQSRKQFEKSLESLNIKHLISSYTTYHSCCQGRVQNIQNMADLVDGTIMAPGEIFSLNDHVGKRTREKNFVPAGTLLQGVLLNTTGGGVSQFTTTMYNAIFWAGLEDIIHVPHSRYFSRYPEGIEATISWPEPHMKFRNNYDSHILIKTSHTDTSITVSIFGDNDGRITRGDHKNKQSTLEILRDGGPEARIVTATKTDRFDPVNKPLQMIADSSIPISGTKIIQKGSNGWKIKIERIITKSGEIFEKKEWTVRYRPETAIIKTNSCESFEGVLPCRTTKEQRGFEKNLVKQFGSGDE